MASAVQFCIAEGLVSPPKWMATNLQYEVIMGSFAYGVSEDTSDEDIYGVVIPPKDLVFPHVAGYIQDFDTIPRFDQWQQHHVQRHDKQFDFAVYNIVRYFRLLCDNNPNIIDSLFVPESCIRHITPVGQLIRDSRRLFLSKRCWAKFRGYAAAQFHKLENKNPEGKRIDLVEKYGYDTKFAYHIIRLLDEAEQILSTGDLSLNKNNEELKAIRRGEWSLERLKKEFEQRKLTVEEFYARSSLQNEPDCGRMKQLLVNCLEMHYGSLKNAFHQPNATIDALKQIIDIADNIRGSIYGA